MTQFNVTIYPQGIFLLISILLAILISGYIWGFVRGMRQSEKRFCDRFLNDKTTNNATTGND